MLVARRRDRHPEVLRRILPVFAGVVDPSEYLRMTITRYKSEKRSKHEDAKARHIYVLIEVLVGNESRSLLLLYFHLHFPARSRLLQFDWLAIAKDFDHQCLWVFGDQLAQLG